MTRPWTYTKDCEDCGRMIVLTKDHFRCPYCEHLNRTPRATASPGSGNAFGSPEEAREAMDREDDEDEDEEEEEIEYEEDYDEFEDPVSQGGS